MFLPRALKIAQSGHTVGAFLYLLCFSSCLKLWFTKSPSSTNSLVRPSNHRDTSFDVDQLVSVRPSRHRDPSLNVDQIVSMRPSRHRDTSFDVDQPLVSMRTSRLRDPSSNVDQLVSMRPSRHRDPSFDVDQQLVSTSPTFPLPLSNRYIESASIIFSVLF